ncbi:MAG: hypothetical protein Q8P97_02355 [bacterium]|nr:hypothetical protein [bacterium]
MAARLKSISAKIPWSLLLRPVFLGALWFFAPWYLTVMVAFLFFWRSGSKPGRLFLSFAVLTALSLLPAWAEFHSPYQLQFRLLFLVCFMASWFLIFAIRELFFVERARCYLLLQAILFFLTTFYFYLQFDIQLISLAGGLFLLVLYLLFYEFFSFVGECIGQERWLFSVISLLIAAELFLAVSLLPIGFLNGTALIFLVFCCYEYFWMDYFSHALHPSRVFLNVSVMLVGLLFIALFSNWKI